jgi:poly-D-alanine transfer protein DltD
MISLPDSKVIEADGYITLSPLATGWNGILAFDKAVKDFLRENPNYEVLKCHSSSQAGSGEWDFVILKPPS